ncbi:MAG: hypothetical protein IKZ07_05830 [Akkermansia sp.]|nr:hypothetical protein [Akkermansia sp.]
MLHQEQPELKQYAAEIRRRIEECDGEVFRNKSARHAAIIIKEFIASAKESVYIYCGHLNHLVYGELKDVFEKAMAEKDTEQTPQIQVLTESNEIDCPNLANFLREKHAFRSLGKSMEIPHFIVVDAKRYRIETNEMEKTALVCACTQTEAQKKRALMMNELFKIMWSYAT